MIPARLASTRLPRKVLREIAGEPLLAWVYRAALRCPQFDELLIAVDSPEVEQLCRDRGWPSIMTDPALPSGTDRLHTVAQHHPADIYVNIQGDEPLLRPEHIEALLRPFTHPHIDVTTLKVPCTAANLHNPNAVKVVTAADGRALYFSRSPIPYVRDAPSTPAGEPTHAGPEASPRHWKHLGLYAYRRAALDRFATLPPGELEQTERLEQLRLLEHGLALYVEPTQFDSIGVDTEDDLNAAEEILLGLAESPAR